MTEEEFNKKVQGTKTFCLAIGIIGVLVCLAAIYLKNYIGAVAALVSLTLLYLFYSFTKKKKIAGPIIGIALGVLYILQFNIITIIMGIFILIDCTAMLKYIREQQ